jgi:hypothetical protein
MDDPGQYWVYVVGKGYFVRFVSHGSQPQWAIAQGMRDGYCFKTVDEAQRVVDQLGRYNRKAQIMKERKAAPPPPPPPLPESPFGPPRRLRSWVDKIVAASNGGDVKVGYRALARKHHPDRGGKTADMQALTEAHAWLRANPQEAAIPFEDPFDDKWREPIWEDPFVEEPISELTDDDIVF